MKTSDLPVSFLCSTLLLGACGIAHAADTIRMVDEGGIRTQWTLAAGATLAMPQYPVDVARSAPVDACMALGYRIAPDGTTSDFRVLKQWNDASGAIEPVDGAWAAFAQSAADAVSQWKFAPRADASPEAVYTVATLTWQTRKDTNPVTLRNRCKIDDLVVFMRNDSDKKGLNDHIIDRTARARDDRIQTFAGTPKNQPGMKP